MSTASINTIQEPSIITTILNFPWIPWLKFHDFFHTIHPKGREWTIYKIISIPVRALAGRGLAEKVPSGTDSAGITLADSWAGSWTYFPVSGHLEKETERHPARGKRRKRNFQGCTLQHGFNGSLEDGHKSNLKEISVLKDLVKIKLMIIFKHKFPSFFSSHRRGGTNITDLCFHWKSSSKII